VKVIALILLAAGIAVLADQLMHRTQLEGLSREADNDPGLAAAHMLESAPLPDCPASGSLETQTAAQALFTIEKVATSRTEHAVEWTLAWLSGILGVPAPDLSYGPGQIRPSTLLEIAATKDLPQAQRDMLRNAALQPLQLFDECRALSLAELMIRHQHAAPASEDALMPRSQLTRIARNWNGQKEAGNADAFIAGLRYQRLVYEVFQRLRFERLRK